MSFLATSLESGQVISWDQGHLQRLGYHTSMVAPGIYEVVECPLWHEMREAWLRDLLSVATGDDWA